MTRLARMTIGIGGYNARMRYRLRTLLIVLALGPPVLALIIFQYRNGIEARKAFERVKMEREARLKAQQLLESEQRLRAAGINQKTGGLERVPPMFSP